MSGWYYAENGQRFGPCSLEHLRERAAAGKLGPSDMVWQEGSPQWVPFGSLPAPAAAAAPAPGERHLRSCELCRGQVASDAYFCPHCGAQQPALAEGLDPLRYLVVTLFTVLLPLGLFVIVTPRTPSGEAGLASVFGLLACVAGWFAVWWAGYIRYGAWRPSRK